LFGTAHGVGKNTHILQAGLFFIFCTSHPTNQDSVVNTATGYRLDHGGSSSRPGRASRPALDALPPLYRRLGMPQPVWMPFPWG
jgi:hypothetical protein